MPSSIAVTHPPALKISKAKRLSVKRVGWRGEDDNEIFVISPRRTSHDEFENDEFLRFLKLSSLVVALVACFVIIRGIYVSIEVSNLTASLLGANQADNA